LKNFQEAFPGRLEINRQQASLQQIDMAIEMLDRREWACAITLALAAESQLPEPENPYVSDVLRSRFGKDFADRLNGPRNWLKHAKDPETTTLHEMDAVMAILRAISKFTSLYRAWSDRMAAFDERVKQADSRASELPSSN
jgi:hypothetical protein